MFEIEKGHKGEDEEGDEIVEEGVGGVEHDDFLFLVDGLDGLVGSSDQEMIHGVNELY
jgi:hypothetical protein